MDIKTKERALKRITKSRRDRALDAMKKNTPENVEKELTEINQRILEMYLDQEDQEKGVEPLTEKDLQRRFLKGLRQR